MKTINDVPLILRREIEALIAGAFVRAFSEKFGKEETLQVVHQVIRELAVKAGKELAERVPENTLEQFMDHILPLFQPSENVCVKETGHNRAVMDITFCPYVEMYRRIGLSDLGAHLSCNRDQYLFEGYNSDIQFTRTKTIMEGQDCCDFCMEIKQEGQATL